MARWCAGMMWKLTPALTRSQRGARWKGGSAGWQKPGKTLKLRPHLDFLLLFSASCIRNCVVRLRQRARLIPGKRLVILPAGPGFSDFDCAQPGFVGIWFGVPISTSAVGDPKTTPKIVSLVEASTHNG